METYTTTHEQRLAAAQKQVKRIKGFYNHLTVYVLVNLFLSGIKFFKNPDTWLEIDNFSLIFWWGCAVAIHGIAVFGQSQFFGSDWEERKINELMNK
ncbi:2TM domain-containing protein [uncultured Chryseobacterium sp.]|uniref:2TM domain-containing protein n=1 Tax=uncultured Chryseobacterium sp. TaxID=259322 RepID=UPI0026146062|nr:2TM domain-containing protein [uncultured Chryseobacterium sp.]